MYGGFVVTFLSFSPSTVVCPPVQVRLAPSSSLPARPEGMEVTPPPQQVPLPIIVVCVSSPDVAVTAVRNTVSENSILVPHSTDHTSPPRLRLLYTDCLPFKFVWSSNVTLYGFSCLSLAVLGVFSAGV